MFGRLLAGHALTTVCAVLVAVPFSLFPGAPARASAEDGDPTPSPPPPAAAPADRCWRFWTRHAGHQIETSATGHAQTVKGNEWTDLDCGRVHVHLRRGEQSMITVWVNAEIRCKGPAGGWCGARVLANGVELHPGAPDDTPFAWDHAQPDDHRYHAASMIRTGVLACPRDTPGPACDFTVQLQAGTNAVATALWYDDATLRAELWPRPEKDARRTPPAIPRDSRPRSGAPRKPART
ncbi:hypothetical protein [Sphaerisporangium sp. TRM90804]|uniref:hypothetical protein n=1 Tax=Sphaerisporangium sp. TRM90804 TaxID=3031113 RepID=UPI002447C66B|nr:hypothetical protein [Sphaerisporangium sp. TRM90804]MDH2429803.1 hypothetical protein [Sphaerisporangium sp. TRM90804]